MVGRQALPFWQIFGNICFANICQISVLESSCWMPIKSFQGFWLGAKLCLFGSQRDFPDWVSTLRIKRILQILSPVSSSSQSWSIPPVSVSSQYIDVIVSPRKLTQVWEVRAIQKIKKVASMGKFPKITRSRHALRVHKYNHHAKVDESQNWASFLRDQEWVETTLQHKSKDHMCFSLLAVFF